MKKISLLVMALVSSFLFAQQPQSYTQLGENQPQVVSPAGGNNQIRGGGVVTFTFNEVTSFIDAVNVECPDPDLTFEDFAGGPGGITTCGATISSAGDDCFAPGELEAGFTVSATGVGSNLAVYIPAGAIGNVDPLVGANSFDDYTIVEFDPPIYAAGWETWDNTSGFVDLRVFVEGGTIENFTLDVGVNTQTFFGFIAVEPITRIELEGQTGGGELFGQFYFGADCEVLSVRDNLLSQIEIYPNPVSNVLNVRTPAGLTVENAQLFDVLGKNTGAQLVNGQLDVSQLARGVYILNLETSGGTLTQKVVKQ